MVASTPVSAQQIPNVVFILADNVGYGDFGAYGDGEPTGRPPARATSLSLSIANTLTVWRVVLGGRVFIEDRPLTANCGAVRVTLTICTFACLECQLED